MSLSDQIDRKFEESFEIPSFMTIEVMNDDGYVPVKSSNKTILYEVYTITFSDGTIVECADDHIFIDSNGVEVFAKDSFGCTIQSVNGNVSVVGVDQTGRFENMYDLSVGGNNLYYTNGILSHNTTTFGLDVLHDVIFTQDYSVGITSYKNKNVIDFMDRIRFAYENLPWWLKPPVKIYNRFTIQFSNDSQIFGEVTSESSMRGRTVNRIISDELAFVRPDISEDFITSLLPSLSSDGDNSTTRLNIVSTPNGTEGVFPSIWFGAVNETNGFAYVEVKYEEVPGRTPEFEKDMVNKMGRDKFDQEFKNKFIGSGGTLVNSRVLESLATKQPVDFIEGFGKFDIFVEKLHGRTIALALDISEGIGEDNHCIQAMDTTTFEQVGEYANNIVNQTMYVKDFTMILKHLFDNGVEEVYYTIENNGIGQGVARLLESSTDDYLERCIAISDVDASGISKKLGFFMGNNKKMYGCGQLKDLLESNRLTINSKKLLTELKFFIKVGQTFKAAKGAKDDRVMAMVLLMLMLDQLVNYEESVDEVINDVDIDDEAWGIVF